MKIRVLCGLGFLLIQAQAFASECAVEVAFAANVKSIDLRLEPQEFPITPLILLPNNRVAAGTAITEKDDTLITGGRFIVADIDSGNIEASIETPTVEGRPTMMRHVDRSNDGKYLTATGGWLFGGPALLYQADPAFEYRGSHQVTRNLIDPAMGNLFNVLKRAAAGNQMAIAEIRQMFPHVESEDIIEAYESDPEGFRREMAKIFSRATGIPADDERIPVMNVHFHPDRQRFLLNAGDSVSIRSARDGREVQRLDLADARVPRSMDPPLVYFLGGGDQVLAYSRQFMTLWDVKSGQALDIQDHAGPTAAVFPRVVSPDANYFSYVVDKSGPTRQLWRVVERDGDDDGKQLRMVAEYTAPGPFRPGSAPTIAFSEKTVYAVGKPGGVVEIRDLETHALVDNGELKIGTEQERENMAAPQVAMDLSGQWLVVSAAVRDRDFLELWSLPQRRGVRLRLPGPTEPGRERGLSSIEFDPKGEWFSFILSENAPLPPKPGVIYVGGAPERFQQVSSEAYVVDVYKTIARAFAPKP